MQHFKDLKAGDMTKHITNNYEPTKETIMTKEQIPTIATVSTTGTEIAPVLGSLLMFAFMESQSQRNLVNPQNVPLEIVMQFEGSDEDLDISALDQAYRDVHQPNHGDTTVPRKIVFKIPESGDLADNYKERKSMNNPYTSVLVRPMCKPDVGDSYYSHPGGLVPQPKGPDENTCAWSVFVGTSAAGELWNNDFNNGPDAMTAAHTLSIKYGVPVEEFSWVKKNPEGIVSIQVVPVCQDLSNPTNMMAQYQGPDQHTVYWGVYARKPDGTCVWKFDHKNGPEAIAAAKTLADNLGIFVEPFPWKLEA